MPNYYKLSFRLFLLLFLSVQFTYAQDKDNYELLWKIEHKDYESPSYLFGTMHIDDARAFNFSDAVLPAIESVKYFALEVNPDSLMSAFISKKHKETANEYYKKLLSPKDYKRLLKRFKEVNNYALEDSEIMDPDLVVTLLIPDFDKDNDKSTFVDMYLFSHAKTMRKEIVGLEDIDTQINYFDNLSDEQKINEVMSSINISIDSIESTKEIMTKIYQTGSLKKIKAFMDSYGKDYMDETMLSRNKEMANSISEYMKTGNIFAAVGAAHLVGKGNVIELLQNKGFKVSVVEANFTGIADTYKIDHSKGLWYSYKDEDLGYQLEIPEAPNLNEDSGNFTVRGYGDLETQTSYMFMGFDLGYELTQDKIDATLLKMVENINAKREGTILDKRNISDEDINGYDVTSELEDNVLMKSRYIIKNNHLYYFSVETLANQIEENYVTRYLNSIIVNGVEKNYTKTTEWREFKSKKGAFSTMIPGEAKDISREQPNPINPDDEPFFLNMYMVIDSANKNNYLIRYNDQPLGYYVQSPDVIFEETQAMLTQKSTLVSPAKVIYLDGIEGREYEIMINDKYHSFARVYYRGHRMYLIIKQKLSDTEKADKNDKFFTDFTFLPYEQAEYKTYSPSDKAFEMKLFEMVSNTKDSTGYEESYLKDSNDYTSVNPKSGGVYQFGYSNIKDYFRIKSYKKFLEDYRDLDLEYTDSIVKEEILVKNGDSIIQYTTRKKDFLDSNRQNITRIWLNNNRLQLAKALVSNEEAKSQTIEDVFNSIRMKPSKSKIDIFSSKAKMIMKDLKSSDSLAYNAAINAFKYYEFDKEELPILHKALQYDFSKAKNNVVKNALIDELVLINDASSVQVLEDFYNKNNTSNELKSAILVALPQIESKESFSTYNRLLFNDPPKTRDSYHYSILTPLDDSLQYTLQHYDKLLALLPYIQYRKDILNISSNMYKSDDLDAKPIVDTKVEQLFRFLQEDYDKSLTERTKGDESDPIYNNILFTYFSLLNELKTDSKVCDVITLNTLEDDSEKWVKLQAVTARIFNGYKTPKALLNEYMDDMFYRFEIMEVYHKQNRLNEIDKQYLKPETFAKLSFFNYTGDYASYPEDITVLKTIKKDGKTFYVMQVEYPDEEDETESYRYVGVVGPVEDISQEKPIKMYEAYSRWEENDDNWEDSLDDLIKELIAN